MLDILKNVIDFLGAGYPAALVIRRWVLAILGIFSAHNVIYFCIGLVATRKFRKAKKLHKYAILIPARNEEAVIGHLLDSIEKQDYPKEYLSVFVVADNCTDSTASVARQHGATCYERFNDAERTKGYALKFLFERIQETVGIESFEGYFIFDSDNLLNRDYVSRMNESFDEGEKIITSYRNTKNFDENWVASTYALHWLRSIRMRHRARSVLRLATNIQGTGFLFSSELVKDGWKYVSLTEDRAFTADAVARGYMVSYNDSAMFYDEQPTSVRIAFRQRIRWSKGHMCAFAESGWLLFRGIFVGTGKKNYANDAPTWQKLLYQLRDRFACFDTFGQLIPSPIITIFIWIVVNLLLYSFSLDVTGISSARLFSRGEYLGKTLALVFGNVKINVAPGLFAVLCGLGIAVFWRICSVTWSYISKIPIAVYVFVFERKRIKKIPLHKKILYCFTWPVFDVFYRYSMYLAFFMKVTWKQIPHTSKVTIDDLQTDTEKIKEKVAK